MVADASASVRSRWVTDDGLVDGVLERLDALDLLQVPRPQPHRLHLDERVEEARDHDHRALRVEREQLLHRAEPVGPLHDEVDHDDVGLVARPSASTVSLALPASATTS